MVIIEDTRQQAGKHEKKHNSFDAEGVAVFRSKLPVGDYAAAPSVAVDTKAGLLEIATNLCGNIAEQQRFARECKNARALGCRLVFLIETGKYKSPRDMIGHNIKLKNGRTIPGEQLFRAMTLTAERYGVKFEFCAPSESGRRIVEILKNDG